LKQQQNPDVYMGRPPLPPPPPPSGLYFFHRHRVREEMGQNKFGGKARHCSHLGVSLFESIPFGPLALIFFLLSRGVGEGEGGQVKLPGVMNI